MSKQAAMKTQKVYQNRKKGWIERLADWCAQRSDAAPDDAHPAVGNLRRFFGYLIDFVLANLLVCIPVVLVESIVNGDANITQDLRVVSLPYAYLIVALVFVFYLFYYVYIPWKIWPGQTPAKRLLDYKIIMMDNSDVTLKALFLRNVIGFVLIEGTVFMTSYLIQLITLSLGYETISPIPGQIYYFLTFLSVIVTLTNRNRRMIHDLIAGTKTYKLEGKKEGFSSF